MTTTVTNPEEYDPVVLGGGEGGKYLAWTLARKNSASSSWSANEMADNSPFVFGGLWEGWSLERGYIFPRHSQITIGIASRMHPRYITRKGQSPSMTS